MLKDIGMTLLNASLLAGIIVGSIFGSKKLATNKKYLTKTTIYNPEEDNPYTVTEEYEKDSESSLELVEYAPWKDSLLGVKRNVTTYDLSDLEKLSYDEYLNLDLDQLKIDGETIREDKDSLTLSDLYENTIRLIREVEVNKEDFIEENSKVHEILLPIALSILGIIIALFICSRTSRYEFDFGNEIPLIYDLECVYEEIKELMHEKSDNKEYEKKVLNLEKKMLEIIKNNEGLLNKVESIIPILENDPEYKEMAEDTKKRLSLIREYSKKISSHN